MLRLFTLLTLFSATHATPTDDSAPIVDSALEPKATYWPGWAGISHMFVFGDSYSRTGFDVNGAQPSRSNPLGNPPYPGDTSSNGPNWAEFLTSTWNKSFVETIDLAKGGATVDAQLIPPYKSTPLSLEQQVNDQYVANYSSHPTFFPWASGNTLFAVFIGINDVNNAYTWNNKSTVYPKVISEYAGLVDQLYHTGARNFLFLNVPAINRSPEAIAAGASAQSTLKTDIAAWNKNVSRITTNLSSTYHDTKTFVFDINTLFNQVLDKPCTYPETCGYTNTTGACPNASICGRYFWYNTLHPTMQIHNLTGEKVAQKLSA